MGSGGVMQEFFVNPIELIYLVDNTSISITTGFRVRRLQIQRSAKILIIGVRCIYCQSGVVVMHHKRNHPGIVL